MTQRASTIIRYDGPALSKHEMDVQHLAPALLAFGNLCKIANGTVNGEMASVKVLVRADIEQKCFQVQIDLVQTFFDRLSMLVDQEEIKDAKTILEWIGIYTGAAALASGGVFGVLRFLSRKKPNDVVSVSSVDSEGNVTISIEGDGNSIIVPQIVERLVGHPSTLRDVKTIVQPLAEDGYDTLEFERNGKRTSIFSKEEARRIVELSDADVSFDREGEVVSVFTASVKVRKAIMEGDAAWGINYRSAVDARMLDRDWLEEYQAGAIPLLPGSKLVVQLREIVQLDDDGLEAGKPKYEIIRVIGLEPPPRQYILPV
ncbi:MAG: hypothetical protein ABJH52_16140 [Henriciella sp.]